MPEVPKNGIKLQDIEAASLLFDQHVGSAGRRVIVVADNLGTRVLYHQDENLDSLHMLSHAEEDALEARRRQRDREDRTTPPAMGK